MKHLFTILINIILLLHLHAQQASQYTMYMYNGSMYNPAYVGLDDMVSFTGMYRQQWLELEGSPNQQYLGVDLPLYFFNGGGGIQVQNENIGARQLTSIIVSGDYNYELPSRAILSGGVGVGYTQMIWNGGILQTPEGNYNDVLIQHEDDILSTEKQTGGGAKVNIGVYYKSNKIEAGFSVENLLNNSISFENVNLPLNRSYYLSLKYNWSLDQNFTLSPMILLKTDILEQQLDFSLVLDYNGNVFGGVGLRGYNSNTLDAVLFLTGVRFNNGFKIMYAYDYAISELKNVHQGSHEILLNYTLNKKIGKGKWPKIIFNPRFL